jgi:hypothetical protein
VLSSLVKQRGRISLWEHQQRHTDWNLAADDVACDGLLELLDLMKGGKWPSQKALIVVKAERTATEAPDRPALFATELILKFRKGEVADDFWQLESTGTSVKLSVGLSRLEQLGAAVADMKNGGGDYAIGSEESPLWVWWFVEGR